MPEPSEPYAGKRVLVTGGLGFIGSNLAIRLAELGARVRVIDAMLPAYGATLENVREVRDQIEIEIIDVRDADALLPLLEGHEGPQVVFSLAGQISHIESMRDPLTDLGINCESQLALLEGLRRAGASAKVVFASTRQLYGRPLSLPVTEDHPLSPVDINGIHKLAAERYHRVYHQVHGIPTVSLRLTNTYGPRMEIGNDRKGFAGIFLRRALEGEKILLYGGGGQKRDFNHVDDVVEALLLAGANPRVDGGVYNLGHPETETLKRFVEILHGLAKFESESVPFPAEAAQIDIGDYQGDFSRFHAATGWQPAIGLEEGLTRSFAWYRAEGWGRPA